MRDENEKPGAVLRIVKLLMEAYGLAEERGDKFLCHLLDMAVLHVTDRTQEESERRSAA